MRKISKFTRIVIIVFIVACVAVFVSCGSESAVSFLPDVEPAFQEGNTYYYQDYSESDFDNYIENLKSKDFSYMDALDVVYMCRDNMMLELYYYYEEGINFEVTVYEDTKAKGMNVVNAEKALELIGDENIDYILEQSDRDVFAKTGIQLFFALNNGGFDLEEDEEPIYRVEYYLIGPNGAVVAPYEPKAGIFVNDFYKDGRQQAVLMGITHLSSSAVSRNFIQVYELQNGIPELVNGKIIEVYPPYCLDAALYEDDNGQIMLRVQNYDDPEDIRLFTIEADSEIRISIKENGIEIDEIC